jgi:hypothetical protein
MAIVRIRPFVQWERRCEVQERGMRRFAWVYFVGFAAWLVDGVVRVRARDTAHGELALLLSAMFLGAALFYRLQRR